MELLVSNIKNYYRLSIYEKRTRFAIGAARHKAHRGCICAYVCDYVHRVRDDTETSTTRRASGIKSATAAFLRGDWSPKCTPVLRVHAQTCLAYLSERKSAYAFEYFNMLQPADFDYWLRHFAIRAN